MEKLRAINFLPKNNHSKSGAQQKNNMWQTTSTCQKWQIQPKPCHYEFQTENSGKNYNKIGARMGVKATE